MNTELGHKAWHVYYLHWVKDCTKIKNEVLLERTMDALEDAASILPPEVMSRGPLEERIHHEEWDYYNDLVPFYGYNYSLVVDVFKCLMRNLFRGFIFSYDELVAHHIHRGRYSDSECYWDPSDQVLWVKLNTKVEHGFSTPSAGLLFSSTLHSSHTRSSAAYVWERGRKATSWFKIVEVSPELASLVEDTMKIKDPSMGDMRNRICGGRREVHRIMSPVTLGLDPM
jgi:hypothetical protein